jgi:hypothetical protein
MKYRNILLVTGVLVALVGCSGDTPLDKVNKCIDEANSIVEAVDLEEPDARMALSEQLEGLNTGVCAILDTNEVPEGIDMTDEQLSAYLFDRMSDKTKEFSFGGIEEDWEPVGDGLE